MAKAPIPDNMNICIVARKFPILGRAADHGFLWPIARGLAQRGHKVTVLSWRNPQGKREIFQDDVHAYFLGENGARNINDFPLLAKEKFLQLHRQEPFHLVHSIDANGYLIGRDRKKQKIAMTYDIEATEMSQLFSILGMAQDTLANQFRTVVAVTYKFLTTYFRKDRQLLNTADGVFVTSPLQRIILERHYLYPDLKTYTIPYGIEIGDLSPKERSQEFRNKLQLPNNANTVMAISDMQELSELKNLLKAFEKVAIKKTSARLIIVGHGPLFKQIEFEMLNLALGSKVIFAGAVSNSDLPEYINLADVFVDLSSRTSGFEPSMLEAMAQKKVIIGSEISPISTIVEDGVDGFLIRPADINALAHLLIQIFSEQLPVEQIGEQARNKVMNIFDTNKMVNLTLDAYKKTLENTNFYESQWSLWKL